MNQTPKTFKSDMGLPPKTLNAEEAESLLLMLNSEQGTTFKTIRSARNHTMALLMLDAGLRVGEVVQMQIGDLWLRNEPVKAVVVRAEIAKNKTERFVPTSERLREAFRRMAELTWPSEGNCPIRIHAFYTSRGRPLSSRQVERIIKAAAIVSIGRPVHPHMLRHTFGSRLMRTTNSRVVMELLGHKQLSSTQIYTHPNNDDLQNAIDSL